MDPASPQLTLLEAARTVARGRDLESQLATLAEHARAASGGFASAIYLLDPLERLLVPAAVAGEGAQPLTQAQSISLDDPRELAAQVVRERRAASDSAGAMMLSATIFAPAGGNGALGLTALPLVSADLAGGEEAEGALLVAFAGSAPDTTAAEDPLNALADLCAVAIRKARLEHALVEKAEWIERLASTDALTGIANRATFERMLELEIARATRQETQLSVVLLDIDDFAGLNQRAGAQAGDDALRRLASLLADQVRLVDTIGRLGADEFGVIAPGGGGVVVARRIGEAAKGLGLSVSAGVVVLPQDGGSSSELLTAAQNALAEAKRRGRRSIVGGGAIGAT
ncbi:MAG: GGDEF domain-containing protein [Chloroflexota bacterium]|nr:GGDEF domain-containing protein [Chloroflexota bacterium]